MFAFFEEGGGALLAGVLACSFYETAYTTLPPFRLPASWLGFAFWLPLLSGCLCFLACLWPFAFWLVFGLSLSLVFFGLFSLRLCRHLHCKCKRPVQEACARGLCKRPVQEARARSPCSEAAGTWREAPQPFFSAKIRKISIPRPFSIKNVRFYLQSQDAWRQGALARLRAPTGRNQTRVRQKLGAPSC